MSRRHLTVLVGLWTMTAAAGVGGFGLIMSIVELAATGRVTDAAGRTDAGQVLRQAAFAASAALLAATATAWWHRARGTCPRCGTAHRPGDVVGVIRPAPGDAPGPVRRVAYGGVAGLVPYAVAKSVVAAGGTVAGIATADLGVYPGMAGWLQDRGIDITVVFAVAGALLLVALTCRFGVVIPRRVLVALGWSGAATLAPYGVLLLLSLPLLAGDGVTGGPVPLWWVLIGGGAFAPLGIALGVATASYQRRTRARCLLANHTLEEAR
jgi:hypothetical protein